MSRVATCNDCGARFKVPETTKAAKAKCPKCGGVLEIPAAEGASPTPKASAPARPAPAKAATPAKAPARKAAAPARKAPAKSSGKAAGTASAARKGRGKSQGAEASSSRSGGGRKAGGKRGKRGGGGGGASSDGGKTGLLLGLLAVVVLGGGAAWYFMKDDSGNSIPLNPATDSSVAGGQGADDNASTGTDDAPETLAAETAPTPIDSSIDAPAGAASDPVASAEGQDGSQDEEAAPAGNGGSGLSALDSLTSSAATSADADQAPEPVQQAAAAKPSKPDLSEPRPTLIEFDAYGPCPGTTEAQLAEWTEMVMDLYITDGGAAGRSRKRLKSKLADVDVVHATPAYLNATNGLDIKDQENIQLIFILVRDWQERVGGTPKFYFNGEVTERSVEEQNKRLIVLDGWRGWWDSTISSDEKLQTYREKMESRLGG